MIRDALCRSFGNRLLPLRNGLGLCYRVTRSGRSLFSGRHSFEVEALLILSGKDIDFREGADALLADLESRFGEVGRVGCCWIVASEHGGIYLHEAIATKENRRYGHMANRFMVLDVQDGTVSFGPGHVDNRDCSEAMRYLIDRRRTMAEATWNHEFDQLLGRCLSISRRG
jgi:hypothetical protein